MRSAHHLVGEAVGFLPCGRPQIELDRTDIPTLMGSLWRSANRLIARLWRPLRLSRTPWSARERMHASQTDPADASRRARGQAQKMAMVGQMASGVAHDFNNAIQVAMLALAVAEKRLNQHRPRECKVLLRDAHAALQRASGSSRRLLDFASPRQDGAKCIELNEAIVGMQGLLRAALGSSVALSLFLDDGMLNLLCDVHELENAVLNLAINARDAMPSGGRLTISSFRADLIAPRAGLVPGRYVGLDLTDTGCGMKPDVAKRAFDAFYTTKPPGQGTGLGLAMVRTFVDEHRGQIDLNSLLGRGTTIRIYLPAAE